MNRQECIIRSQRVITSQGIRPAAIVVRQGQIAEIAGHGVDPGQIPVTDVGRDVVMPGLVDTHVHVNEPGRTEWEGYATATAAAAAGGITTLVDMPLNSIPPTTTLAALAQKREAAQGQCHIDVGFWGGVVPGNLGELRAMVDAGIMGFKCFLVDSGVAEFGFVGERDARAAMGVLAEARVPLLVHAELPGPIDQAATTLGAADPRRYATYLASRPPSAEEEAIHLMIALARATGARVHIVHLAASGALPAIEAARQDGVAVTVETCPHYLHFAAEAIPDGATEFKCAPPIRPAKNREALWQGLAGGGLDMIVSDHSPCTVALKGKEAGDFMAAWGGISSLQLTLPITWTNAERRGLDLARLCEWMCEKPARLAGLQGKKGALLPGHDADLVIWDPDAEVEVHATELAHRNKITPYEGERLKGVVKKTFLRGQLVYDRAGHHAGAARPASPAGTLLTRQPS